MNSIEHSSFFSRGIRLIAILLLAFLIFSCQDQISDFSSEESPHLLDFGHTSPADFRGADRYIVVFDRQQVPAHQVESTLRELTNRFTFQPDFVYQHTISGFAGAFSPRDVQALRDDDRVLRITRDIEISLFPDPQHHQPDHGGGPPDRNNGDDNGDEEEETTQVIPWGIDRVGGPLARSGNFAWVIDTGIDLDHADLNVNTDYGKNCVTRGRNSFHDGNGHGTHVAGTIAAIYNTIDVVGVTESTELVPARVLDNSGSGFLSWIICGVDHVGGNFKSGDVANMSLGGRSTNTSLDEAVVAAAQAGVLFSIAAGNSGDDASEFTPARTGNQHDNIFTIAAINQNDAMPSWSNFGDPVSYAAPGVGILSTKRNGGTEKMSGTSMSAPHVAGLLLLNQLCDDGTVEGTEYKIAYWCKDDALAVAK
ncbi:MAG: S8 family serine peptidase [Balneolaceae bacterium]